MPFEFEDVENALKSLSKGSNIPAGLSHCQRLKFLAQALHFQSYDHLCRTLRGLPEDAFAEVSNRIIRTICSWRLPARTDIPYYEYEVRPKEVSYYGAWVGWDKHGKEVRVPRPLHGFDSVQRVRQVADFPIYVIDTDREWVAWFYFWRSTAYLPEGLAKRHFEADFCEKRGVTTRPPENLLTQKISTTADASNTQNNLRP